MSSMTLKQFMTRGMEKRGFTINPNWTPGKGDMFGPNAKLDSATQATQLNYLMTLYNRLTPDQKNALGIHPVDIITLSTTGKPSDNLMKLVRVFSSGKPDIARDYWKNIPEAEQVQKLIIRNLEGAIESALPGILSDDPKFMNQLDKDPTLLQALEGQKPSEAIRGLLSKFTEDSGMRKFLLGLAKTNPNLFKAFAHKYILQGLMQQMGMDPSKVYDYAPGLKAYDMNQHLPGMAAAFGIPFGIGALTGHPGWGALLGLLGAGGYGYYKYNQMAGTPFGTPPDLDKQYVMDYMNGKDPDAWNVDPKKTPPAKTEALPAPAEPAPEAAPAPTAKAPATEAAPTTAVSKEE